MTEERVAYGRRIDDLALRRLRNEFGRVYRELAILPNLLAEGEEVIDLTSAQLLLGPGLMVLTSTRILFVRYRITTWTLSVKTLPYETVTRYKLVSGRKYPRIVMYIHRPARRRDQWREFYRITPPESGARIAATLGEMIPAGTAGVDACRERLAMSAERVAFGRRVDELALQRLGERFSTNYRELAVLPNVLDADEDVLDLTNARFRVSKGLLVLTSTRILFFRYRIFTRAVYVKSFPYQTLTRRKLISNKEPRIRIYVRIRPQLAEREKEFYGIDPPESGRRIADSLDALIAVARSNEPVHDGTPAAQARPAVSCFICGRETAIPHEDGYRIEDDLGGVARHFCPACWQIEFGRTSA